MLQGPGSAALQGQQLSSRRWLWRWSTLWHPAQLGPSWCPQPRQPRATNAAAHRTMIGQPARGGVTSAPWCSGIRWNLRRSSSRRQQPPTIRATSNASGSTGYSGRCCCCSESAVSSGGASANGKPQLCPFTLKAASAPGVAWSPILQRQTNKSNGFCYAFSSQIGYRPQ